MRPVPVRLKSRKLKTRRRVSSREKSSSVVEFAGDVAAADDGADGRSRDDVRDDACFLEGAQHTDVCPSARGTPTQCQADLSCACVSACYHGAHSSGPPRLRDVNRCEDVPDPESAPQTRHSDS